jgi:hypothetical protein
VSQVIPNPPVSAANALALPPFTGQFFEEGISQGGGAFGNWQSGNTGTSSFINRVAGGNVITNLSRLNYVQVGLGTVAGPFWNTVTTGVFIGNSGVGGFNLWQQFGTSTVFNADLNAMFGVLSTVSPVGITPSTNDISQVLFGCDAGDANWQIMHRLQGSGGTTKIDTGVAKAANQYFVLQISAAPSVAAFNIRVDQITGINTVVNIVPPRVLSGANIPAQNTVLFPLLYVGSASTLVSVFKNYSRLILPYQFSLAGIALP